MSSIDAAALFWRPPSPYEYTLAREIMRLSMRHMSSDEYQLVRALLVECDDDDAYLALLDGESVRELLSGVRKTIRWWLEGEPTP